MDTTPKRFELCARTGMLSRWIGSFVVHVPAIQIYISIYTYFLFIFVAHAPALQKLDGIEPGARCACRQGPYGCTSEVNGAPAIVQRHHAAACSP
eukprot:1151186-Pelagomonas_calceolata.AAC.9